MKTSLYLPAIFLLSIGLSLSAFQNKTTRTLAKGMTTDIQNRVIVVAEESDKKTPFNKIIVNIYENPTETPDTIQIKNGEAEKILFTVNGLSRHFDGTFYIWGSRSMEKEVPKQWALQFDLDGKIIAEASSDLRGEWKDACQSRDGTIYLAGTAGDAACLGSWPYQENASVQVTTIHSLAAATTIAISTGNQLYLAGYTTENNRKKLTLWEKNGQNIKTFLLDGLTEKSVFSMIPSSLLFDSEGNFYLSGTARELKNREEVFWLKLNQDKEPVGSPKYCCGTGDDGLKDMIRLNKGHYLLSGYTTSHSKGARASVPLHWILDTIGKEQLKIDSLGKSLRDETAIKSILWKNEQIVGVVNWLNSIEMITLPNTFLGPSSKPNGGPEIKFDISDTIFSAIKIDTLIQAGTRAFKWFTISNRSKSISYSNLLLEIDEKIAPRGLSVPKEIMIDYLFPGQTKRVAIPIRATFDIEASRGEFVLQVRDKNTNLMVLRATPDRRTFKIDCQPKVYLSLTDRVLKRSGDSVEVQLYNPGNSPLNNITLYVQSCPFYISIPVKNLEAHSRDTLSVFVEIPGNYAINEIKINFSVYKGTIPLISLEKKYSLSPFDFQSLKLEKEVLCFLIDPSPGLYCQEQIGHYNDDRIIGKVRIVSKKPIEKKNCRTCQLNVYYLDKKEIYPLSKNKSGFETQINLIDHSGDNYVYSLEFEKTLSEENYKDTIVGIQFEGEFNDVKCFSDTALLKIEPRDLYLIPIGVEEELDYSKNDARDIKNFFNTQKNNDLFRSVFIDSTFINQLEVKNDEVRSALRAIQPEENDLLIFFISAHGVNVNLNFTLLTTNYYEKKYALPEEERKRNKLNELARNHGLQYKRDIFNEIKEKKGYKLILIDACHSGNTEDIEDITRDTTDEIMNMTTIVSSYGHRKSFECAKFGNGIFTEAILRALAKEGDFKEDQIITIREFYTFVKNEVQKLAQDIDCFFELQTLQVPTITQNGLPEDFPIYQLRSSPSGQ